MINIRLLILREHLAKADEALAKAAVSLVLANAIRRAP